MRRTRCALATALLGLITSASSHAAPILSDNFDSYANQAAFDAVWPANTTAAVLNTEQALSPTQSIKALTTATRSARNVGEIGFLNGTSDMVVFRINFYDSNGAAAAYRQYAELDDGLAPGSAGQLYALGLNNNIASTKYMARILGADGGAGLSSFFKLDDAGSPNRSTGWHSLEADISDNSVKYFVDGILSKTVDITALTDRSLDTVKLGSNLTSTSVAYFDDAFVDKGLVPEPASMAILGFAALLFGKRRSR